MIKQPKTPSQIWISLMFLSLLPLLYALLIALAEFAGWQLFTAQENHFARINSYIYAHSYGALLLCLLTGALLGQLLSQPQHRLLTTACFILLMLCWFSFKSFADRTGLLMLFSCWLAAAFLDFIARQHDLMPAWFSRTKIQLDVAACCLLLALVLINR